MVSGDPCCENSSARCAAADRADGMKIVYVANVDWFFVSHFLHLARQARRAGFDVSVATHTSRHREQLLAENLRVIDLPQPRTGFFPSGLFRSAWMISKELRRAPGSIVHGFGLFGIFAGTFAAIGARHTKRVFTITGRGYSAVSGSLGARSLSFVCGLFCRYLADGASTRWIAENGSDLAFCRLADVAGRRAAVVGGAGVDLDRFNVAPMPERPPFKCAVVARMIWSKGIDTAVAAITIAKQKGFDVELDLAGALDPGNARSFTAADMANFQSASGVRWLGRVEDIDAFWAKQHLALLPSRGGEGVPKSLLEAAACGRPSLTTNVPGCREFARATHGWTVAPDDAEALAAAIIEIANSAHLADAGIAARKEVGENYTETKLWNTVQQFYADLGAMPHRTTR
jgi:glycosyltransferase involved in cell wall biosynthesis